MISLDGSFGEGGGQILRTALAMSVITQKPVEIINVRRERHPPGLQPQHLMAVLAIAEVSRGVIEGAHLHSQHITFHPGKPIGGNYFFDIQTAGSAILVLQTLLPILLFTEESSLVKIIGGTHLPKSPSFDYFEKVFLPAVRLLGVNADVFLERSGYYPRGGGEVILKCTPSKLKGCQEWKFADNKHAIIRLGNLPTHIALREENVIKEFGFEDITIIEEFTFSPGNALILWQNFCGQTGLGKLGVPAEKVASETAELFLTESAEIDQYLADQLLLYAALAQGQTKYTTNHFSDHLVTQSYVLSKFLDKTIELKKDGLISIH